MIDPVKRSGHIHFDHERAYRVFRRLRGAFRDGGTAGVRRYLGFVAEKYLERVRYWQWIAANPADERTGEHLSAQPLISVLLPVHNIDERLLRRCIGSVLDQTYSNWELCIADDASPGVHIRSVLDELSAADDRIKVKYRNENGNISAASNTALELATGEFAVLLDHDDELAKDALFWVANEIVEHPGCAIVYSDEDLIDAAGRRFEPKFKPDFSRDLLYSLNLLTHLSAFRTERIRAVGGFRIGFEGSQDHDLVLRILETINESEIRHIPRILYHWRVIPGSVAFSLSEKPQAIERGRAAIREHLERTGKKAEVLSTADHLHRVRYQFDDARPKISIIVSSCEYSRGEPYSAENIAERIDVAINERRARSLNDAAAASTGDVLVFLDADLVAGDHSIEELARFAIQHEIGAVGGKILTPDHFVEQSGIVLGDGLCPVYAHAGLPKDVAGNVLRNTHIGNCSAVSVSCMAISRSAFESVGGFDADAVPDSLFDVDLCLRLWRSGKQIVVTPYAEFVRTGKHKKREHSPEDLERFRERWPEYAVRDPFCNENLKRDGSFRIDV